MVQLSTVRYGEFPLGGLVYGPGGDEFTDFPRLGAPLRIILMVVTTLAIVAIRRRSRSDKRSSFVVLRMITLEAPSRWTALARCDPRTPSCGSYVAGAVQHSAPSSPTRG